MVTQYESDDDVKALAQLAVDTIDQAKDLTQAIHTTCDTLLRRLDEPVVPGLQGSIDEILQVLRAEKQPPTLDWKRLAGLGGAVALLAGLAGWYVGHTPALVRQQAALMQHINVLLLERHTALPADIKAKLAKLYTQHRFPTIEQQGGK